LPQVKCAQIPVEEIDQNEKYSSFDIQKASSIAKQLPRELVKDVLACVRSISVCRPQVVHIWLDETNIKAGFAAVTLGVPQIVLGTRSMPPINFRFYQPYMREGYRWLLKQPNVTMLNNSFAGARAYEKWLGLPTGNIKVIHNGFDFNESVLQKHREGRSGYRGIWRIPLHLPVVGSIMRLSDEKRPLLWLEIARHVKKVFPEVCFLIVGDGPMRSQVEVYVKKYNLENAIRLVGYEKESLTALAAMDIFLLTSRVEGLPNVLIEAQAMGVPVITTNAGGAEETLQNGLTGWVVDAHDAKVIAQKVIETIHDENWRQQASLAAPQFVKERFNVKRMIEKTKEVYEL
jgi:glycosyltransferase involved in cell wall biosynthesis